MVYGVFLPRSHSTRPLEKEKKRKKVVHGFGIVLLTHRLGSRYISKSLAQLHLLPRDMEKDKELVERTVCVKNKKVDSRKKSNKPINA